MVNTLSGSVSAYRNESIKKRNIQMNAGKEHSAPEKRKEAVI